mmetsp:Transcript_22701/g.36467  ORF Transcript_22701/g.36467 Transcript_22701/m.36467 type:complete len:118 (-) Transcript_22701:1877-2230(-)
MSICGDDHTVRGFKSVDDEHTFMYKFAVVIVRAVSVTLQNLMMMEHNRCVAERFRIIRFFEDPKTPSFHQPAFSSSATRFQERTEWNCSCGSQQFSWAERSSYSSPTSHQHQLCDEI